MQGEHVKIDKSKPFEEQLQQHINISVPKKKFCGLRFVLEIISQCIYPYPFYDTVLFVPQLASAGVNYVPYFLNDLLMVIMFVRIHAVFRHWERYHQYTDTMSKKICRDFGFESGRGFTCKYEINNNQARSICALFTCSVATFSFILRVAELPYE